MARRPSLKPQLNQIRTWVGEGVTDIWIAHQLDRTPVEIADFRRQQGLLRPGEEAPAPKRRAAKPKAAPAPKPKATEAETEAPSEDEPAKKRRRGRRGGRGRGKGKAAIAATLAHTDTGVVITIDAAVLESETYREHWAEAAAANVTVTADGIAIARAD